MVNLTTKELIDLSLYSAEVQKCIEEILVELHY